MRSPSRSSHSPIRSMLRSGVRFSTTPGAITSLEEKITPPTMRSLGIAARKAPPGSRKERSGGAGWLFGRPMSYHQGMPFWAKMMAVSSPSSGFAPSASAAHAGGLQGADDDVLRAEIGRIVGRLDRGVEFCPPTRSVRPLFLHRRQMRPAHHARHLVAGTRQPHRKMAADGARAENTDAHEMSRFQDGAPVSDGARRDATRPAGGAALRRAKGMDQARAVGHSGRQTTQMRIADAGKPSPVDSR